MLNDEGRRLIESISGDRIMETIRFLAVDVGRRITGTPQAKKAIEYFERQYREIKIDTQIHEFGFLLWDTENTNFEIITPVSRKVRSGYSSFGVPTPPRGIVGELVHIDAGWPEDYFERDVKGKIVLVARYTQPGMGPTQEGSPYRFHCVMNAAKRGAIAYVEYDPIMREGKDGDQVRKSHGQLSWGNPTSDMLPTIPILSVSSNEAKILKDLMEKGLVTVKVTALPSPDRKMYDKGHNLIATVRGDLFRDDFVVLCGHIDAAYSPGANDNASGTSMPLEIARVLKGAGASLRRTIKLCHWTGEHPGMIGSTEYVLDNFEDVERHCAACLNFENMGHIKTETYWMDRCPELIPLMDEALQDSGFWQRYQGIKHFRKQSLGPISDHDTFYWNVGIPSVEYHWGEQWSLGDQDTFDKCDPEKIRFGCRLGLSTLLKIANALILPFDFSSYSNALQEVLRERVQSRVSDIRCDEAFDVLRALEMKGEKLNKARAALDAKYSNGQDAKLPAAVLEAIDGINRDIRKTCHLLNRKKEREPMLTSDYGILFELEEKAEDYLKIREAVERVGTTNYIDLPNEVAVLKGRMKELLIEQDLSKITRRLKGALEPLESAVEQASGM